MELAGIDKNTKDVKGGVIEAVIPNYTVEQYKEGILAYQKEAASYGITAYFESMVNLDGSSNLVKVYEEWDKDEKFFKVTTIKLLVDGVIEGKTAVLSEPMQMIQFIKENYCGNRMISMH